MRKGTHHVWTNVNESSGRELLPDVIETIIAHLDLGATIIVHCRRGRHRTGAVCVILLARDGAEFVFIGIREMGFGGSVSFEPFLIRTFGFTRESGGSDFVRGAVVGAYAGDHMEQHHWEIHGAQGSLLRPRPGGCRVEFEGVAPVQDLASRCATTESAAHSAFPVPESACQGVREFGGVSDCQICGVKEYVGAGVARGGGADAPMEAPVSAGAAGSAPADASAAAAATPVAAVEVAESSHLQSLGGWPPGEGERNSRLVSILPQVAFSVLQAQRLDLFAMRQSQLRGQEEVQPLQGGATCRDLRPGL